MQISEKSLWEKQLKKFFLQYLPFTANDSEGVERCLRYSWIVHGYGSDQSLGNLLENIFQKLRADVLHEITDKIDHRPLV